LYLHIEKIKFEFPVMAKDKNWIQKSDIKKGALRKQLGVPAGKDIPKAKLKKAENSKNPLLKKRVILAETLSKLRKKKR